MIEQKRLGEEHGEKKKQTGKLRNKRLETEGPKWAAGWQQLG